MPRYHWRAEGCPPYPPDIVDKLEAALAKDFPEVEISVLGKAYAIRLKPQPFRQYLKSDRTKSRHVLREEAPAPWAVRLGRCIADACTRCIRDPAACCKYTARTRLRRHGILLLLVVTSLWMATVVFAVTLGGTVLLAVYVNSFAFWGCFLQAALSSTG